MKKYIPRKSFRLLVCLGILLLSTTSCNEVDGEGENASNAVYLETTGNGVEHVTLESEGGSAYLSPRLANLSNSDVTIHLEYDQSILDNYNVTNKTNYTALPTEAFRFITPEGKTSAGNADVVVPAGEISASLQIKIEDLNAYPTTAKYAIPVRITRSSDYALISKESSTVIILSRPIISSCMRLKGNGIRVIPDYKGKELTEWTIQASIYFTSLELNNQTTVYAKTTGGEFYTRIKSSAGIQVKNDRDGEDTWTQVKLSAGKWFHIAFVYKERTVTVYINGQVQKTFPVSALSFKEEGHLTIGNLGWTGDNLVRELRLWGKALTENEINDNLYQPLDPDTEGLVCYMPFSTASGLRDLKVAEEVENVTVLDKAVYSFVDNVKFPSEGLVIVDENNE